MIHETYNVSWNSGPVALRPEAYAQAYQDWWEGYKAFHAEQDPQPDWSTAKVEGWNTAGLTAYNRAWQQEYSGYVGREYADDWVGA